MNARIKNTILTCAGLMLSLIVGAPAVADDTELLLATPEGAAGKPNVLFIIDTSGSMKKYEPTTAPYKAATNYGGACVRSRVYWSKDGSLPDCATTTNFINGSKFNCQKAAHHFAGLGFYSGVMAQYRGGGPNGTGSGPQHWQELASGYNASNIECEADFGIHGDGTAGYNWPLAGSDLGASYTNDPDKAISWGSAPVSTKYTVYSGNYLNWKNNPVTISHTRWGILRDVLVPMFTSLDNMNVGMMRFQSNNGGRMFMAMKDLEANRAQAIAVASTPPLDLGTPLDKTMAEAAAYWTGINTISGHSPVDAAAVNPYPKYRQPPAPTGCAKNFNIYLSDGNKSDHDLAAPNWVNRLTGWSAWNGTTMCHGTDLTKNDNRRANQECLDDVAAYLYERDVHPAPGIQNVSSHFIGFGIDEPSMKKAAARSGGQYFVAEDYEDLVAAMTDIFSDIDEATLSFVAPAVAVNSFNRTRNLNDVYLPVFSPQSNIHWPGNLKKYGIKNGQIVDASGTPAVDPDSGFFKEDAKSIWTVGDPDGNEAPLGGAAHKLPAPASRKLYSNNVSNDLTAAGNAVKASNADSIADSVLGLTGGAGEPSKTDLLDWMNGVDVQDEDDDPTTTVRNAMGDPLHSQPAAILYGGTEASPDVVIFNATNDGYLHAIDGATGVELWSFIPKELLANMSALYDNPDAAYKNYGIDGHLVPVVTDDNHNGIIDGTDIAYLIFGLRRGGNAYFALDVTNKTGPKLLWKRTLTDGGQSWSKPVVTQVDIDIAGQNARNAVVILGGGYDSVQDTNAYTPTADAVGAGVHMLDLVSGAELWRAGRDVAADLQLATMTRSIPTEVRVIDMTGDGLADRMYASDMGGQLLRFDISNGQTPANLVAGGVIAQLGAEGLGSPVPADNRRFYNAPDASIFTDRHQNRRYISLSIGSGYRAHPLDNSSSDRFYSVRDPDVFNRLPQTAYDSYNVVTETDLVEVSGQVRTIIGASKKGWKFTLPANQKVLAGAKTFDDSVFFVGFSPESSGDGCTPTPGKNFLYRVHVENGDPAISNQDLQTLPAADADDKRVTELAQGGIAPTPTLMFPSPDDPSCTGAACAPPPPLYCVGVECGDPDVNNTPIRTVWTQDGVE